MNRAEEVALIRTMLKHHDYEGVFSYGGCFHFALRLHERLGLPIRGVRESGNPLKLAHVWVLKGDRSIDIHGVHPEKLFATLVNGGHEPVIEDVPVSTLTNVIRGKEYPPEFTQELNILADRILDTHVRFAEAP